jgi:hypothetical protein
MPFARAGAEAIPKGKIDAANISPLAALNAVRRCAVEFVMRMPFVLLLVLWKV